MKIYNGGKIFIGLIIFGALVAFPFYLNMGKDKATAEPGIKIDTPEILKLEVKQCIEPKEYMRANHMKILDTWRDSVVRNGDSDSVRVSGRIFEKSLQNGCLKCHSNKEDFCDKCHGYLDVKPTCWECHIAPKEKKL
jgi:hypothetical protein